MAWRESASVLAYRGGWRAVRYLPEPAAYALFDRMADAAWLRKSRGAQRLRTNLARVVPESSLDEVTRAGMRSYLRYWCEVFRLPDWDTDRIVSRIRIENEHNMRAPLDAGVGLVGAVPHMGNWDHCGAWVTLSGAKVTSVAERLKPEAIYQDFLAFRQGLGMEILPHSGGGIDVFSTLVDRVQANHFVPLLADRDLTDRGVPVTFFGEQASMPAGPAALALRTGAPLVPVTLWYEGEQPNHIAVLHFGDPVTVPSRGGSDAIRDMTQQVADAFEEKIREHPADWHMLQRLFRADLTPR
jgi:phosphatidylinositol dimannoside acyltransferase